MQENGLLELDLKGLEVEEIEVFLQEGSKGVPALGASCSTICYWLCCTPSCNQLPPDVQTQQQQPTVESSLEIPKD